ncbi:type II secretion system protein N [Erwinia typographi]|uniref:type II secretion system protein N n=1 Tax=Erwinia typographi TaxID=371042 RepID=UPI00068D3187|nr:type II secretion system protein N [Erwinia typographi]
MNIREIKFYDITNLLNQSKKSLNLLFYGCLTLPAIAVFVFACLDTRQTLSADRTRFTFPESTEEDYPALSLQQQFAQLGNPRQLSEKKEGRERFRVGPNVSDELLLLAPRATLNEKIVGILFSTEQKRSIAIIDSGGTQKSYLLGDKIAGEFPVLRILTDRVIIDDNGFYAALFL